MGYAPCPKCNAIGAERMSFTWWGGVIGPKLLTHVKCPRCGHGYNGKTGCDNTTKIVVYSGAVGVIVMGFTFFMVSLGTFLTFFVK